MKRATTTAAVLLLAIAAPAPATADSTRANQWHLKTLDVAEAHRISDGRGVTVAVIDSGVGHHRDLDRNVLPGADFSGEGAADGRADENGHGTAMAGLIASKGHGGDGALGIAPGAKILPIRYGVPSTKLDGGALARCIRWAVQEQVAVISISLAGDGDAASLQAVRSALDAGIVVVAGVGNRPESVSVGAPANYPGVLAVGATDREGRVADASVRGKRLQIVAPGVDIVSTGPSGTYRRGTGTSDSTAIVAGAVALVRSRFPTLSAEEVIHRLAATAIDKGPPGRDDSYGYGLLNLVGALTADVPPLQPSGTPVPATTRPEAAKPATPPAGPGPGRRWYVVGALGVAVVAAGGALMIVMRRRRVGGD